VVLLHHVLVNLLHWVSASSLNESMSSIAILDMLGGIFLCAWHLYLTGPLLVRTDQQTHFWSGHTILATKNGPPGLVLALDRFWSRTKFFVTGRCWWSLFYRTEQSTQKTRTAIYIYKSSLQRLISMSYISYMLVLILLELELPPSCLYIQFFLDTRIRATRVPACRTQHWRALSRCMQFMEIKHFSEDVRSCSVFS